MPYIDYDDPAVWESLYRRLSDDGTRELHYEREAKSRILGTDHWSFLTALGIERGESIILIGSGFGWVGEDWEAAGYGPLVSNDTSAWIHANKSEHAVVPIQNEDILTTKGRNNLKQLLPKGASLADWCITEDVLPSLLEEEVERVVAACRDLGTRVAHWITPGYGPDGTQSPLQPAGNWKSCEAWKAVVAPDLVVWRGLSRVF